MAELGMAELGTLEEECRDGMVRWWNESRYSKHGSKAAWTYNAFMGSVRRVAVLPAWKQTLLVKAGIEQGWQALKWEYMGDKVQPPVEAGLQPVSQAAQEAIERWKLNRNHS